MPVSVEQEMSLSVGVHALAAGLARHDWRFDERILPDNGLYLMFEPGERVKTAQGPVDRIVRVAGHRKQGKLCERLRACYGTPYSSRNKHPPALRGHYADALARREASLEAEGGTPADLEQRVSDEVRSRFTFCVLPVGDADERYELERALIALLAQSPAALPSKAWLGRWSPERAIAESGLWNVKHVGARPLDEGQFARLVRYASDPTHSTGSASACAAAAQDAVKAAESLFLGSLGWLRSTYGLHGFVTARDVVWTLQKRMASVARRTLAECEVHAAVPDPVLRGRPLDIAVVDEDGKVLLVACVAYEPDAGRASRDLRFARLPATSWAEVTADARRVREIAASGRAPVAYSLLIDEGDRYRGRDLPGSMHEAWQVPDFPWLAVSMTRAGR